jgi:hypothetical protein
MKSASQTRKSAPVSPEPPSTRRSISMRVGWPVGAREGEGDPIWGREQPIKQQERRPDHPA